MLEETQNEQEETEDSKTLLTISDPEPENSEAENFEEIPHLAADPADQAIEESKPVAERPKHIEEKHWDVEKAKLRRRILPNRIASCGRTWIKENTSRRRMANILSRGLKIWRKMMKS